GLAQGDADGRFRPSAPVSRQELAALASRAASQLGVAARAAGAASAAYADADAIARWAAEPVADAARLGLMAGDGGRFEPARAVTRAEAAAVLVRLLRLAELI
ncbi:S-layer homology domain-containing protein, partial [Paenibacillus pasadenensis]